MFEIYGHPINCNPKDIDWIKEQLDKNPYKARNLGIMDKYTEIYSQGKCPVFDEGKCRREANRRLREHIGKILELQK